LQSTSSPPTASVPASVSTLQQPLVTAVAKQKTSVAMTSSRDPRARAAGATSKMPSTITDTVRTTVDLPTHSKPVDVGIQLPSSSGVNIFDLLKNLALPTKTTASTVLSHLAAPSVVNSRTAAFCEPSSTTVTAVVTDTHSLTTQSVLPVRTSTEVVPRVELQPPTPAVVNMADTAVRRSPSPAVTSAMQRSASPAIAAQSSSSCSVLSTCSSTDVNSSRTEHEDTSSVQSDSSLHPEGPSVATATVTDTPSNDNINAPKSLRSQRKALKRSSPRDAVNSRDSKPSHSTHGKVEVRRDGVHALTTRRRTLSREADKSGDKTSRTKSLERKQKDGRPAAKKSKHAIENDEHSKDSATAGLPNDLSLVYCLLFNFWSLSRFCSVFDLLLCYERFVTVNIMLLFIQYCIKCRALLVRYVFAKPTNYLTNHSECYLSEIPVKNYRLKLNLR